MNFSNNKDNPYNDFSKQAQKDKEISNFAFRDNSKKDKEIKEINKNISEIFKSLSKEIVIPGQESIDSNNLKLNKSDSSKKELKSKILNKMTEKRKSFNKERTEKNEDNEDNDLALNEANKNYEKTFKKEETTEEKMSSGNTKN